MAQTLQRGQEVVGLTAEELNRETQLWILPGQRTKNGRGHVVPLSAQCIELLDSVFGGMEWSGPAFPSPNEKTKPMTRAALTRALTRIRQQAGLDHFTVHDLRRTGATRLTGEQLGYERFVVSQVLNHRSDTGGGGASIGVYDRHSYLLKKRQALNAWASYIDDLVLHHTPSANDTTDRQLRSV